jgi:hypothetical protein
MGNRKSILDQLLGFEQPLKDLKNALARFEWDSEEELSLLSLEHLSGILRRFLSRDISAADVEDWANVIEGRDDIGFELGNRAFIRETLHELANPLLTQPLDLERARELLAMIDVLAE